MVEQVEADPAAAPGWVRKVIARAHDRNTRREELDRQDPGYLWLYIDGTPSGTRPCSEPTTREAPTPAAPSLTNR